jgi:hypothetical protein
MRRVVLNCPPLCIIIIMAYGGVLAVLSRSFAGKLYWLPFLVVGDGGEWECSAGIPSLTYYDHAKQKTSSPQGRHLSKWTSSAHVVDRFRAFVHLGGAPILRIIFTASQIADLVIAAGYADIQWLVDGLSLKLMGGDCTVGSCWLYIGSLIDGLFESATNPVFSDGIGEILKELRAPPKRRSARQESSLIEKPKDGGGVETSTGEDRASSKNAPVAPVSASSVFAASDGHGGMGGKSTSTSKKSEAVEQVKKAVRKARAEPKKAKQAAKKGKTVAPVKKETVSSKHLSSRQGGDAIVGLLGAADAVLAGAKTSFPSGVSSVGRSMLGVDGGSSAMMDVSAGSVEEAFPGGNSSSSALTNAMVSEDTIAEVSFQRATALKKLMSGGPQQSSGNVSSCSAFTEGLDPSSKALRLKSKVIIYSELSERLLQPTFEWPLAMVRILDSVEAYKGFVLHYVSALSTGLMLGELGDVGWKWWAMLHASGLTLEDGDVDKTDFAAQREKARQIYPEFWCFLRLLGSCRTTTLLEEQAHGLWTRAMWRAFGLRHSDSQISISKDFGTSLKPPKTRKETKARALSVYALYLREQIRGMVKRWKKDNPKSTMDKKKVREFLKDAKEAYSEISDELRKTITETLRWGGNALSKRGAKEKVKQEGGNLPNSRMAWWNPNSAPPGGPQQTLLTGTGVSGQDLPTTSSSRAGGVRSGPGVGREGVKEASHHDMRGKVSHNVDRFPANKGAPAKNGGLDSVGVVGGSSGGRVGSMCATESFGRESQLCTALPLRGPHPVEKVRMCCERTPRLPDPYAGGALDVDRLGFGVPIAKPIVEHHCDYARRVVELAEGCDFDEVVLVRYFGEPKWRPGCLPMRLGVMDEGQSANHGPGVSSTDTSEDIRISSGGGGREAPNYAGASSRAGASSSSSSKMAESSSVVGARGSGYVGQNRRKGVGGFTALVEKEPGIPTVVMVGGIKKGPWEWTGLRLQPKVVVAASSRLLELELKNDGKSDQNNPPVGSAEGMGLRSLGAKSEAAFGDDVYEIPPRPSIYLDSFCSRRVFMEGMTFEHCEAILGDSGTVVMISPWERLLRSTKKDGRIGPLDDEGAMAEDPEAKAVKQQGADGSTVRAAKSSSKAAVLDGVCAINFFRAHGLEGEEEIGFAIAPQYEDGHAVDNRRRKEVGAGVSSKSQGIAGTIGAGGSASGAELPSGILDGTKTSGPAASSSASSGSGELRGLHGPGSPVSARQNGGPPLGEQQKQSRRAKAKVSVLSEADLAAQLNRYGDLSKNPMKRDDELLELLPPNSKPPACDWNTNQQKADRYHGSVRVYTGSVDPKTLLLKIDRKPNKGKPRDTEPARSIEKFGAYASALVCGCIIRRYFISEAFLLQEEIDEGSDSVPNKSASSNSSGPAPSCGGQKELEYVSIDVEWAALWAHIEPLIRAASTPGCKRGPDEMGNLEEGLKLLASCEHSEKPKIKGLNNRIPFETGRKKLALVKKGLADRVYAKLKGNSEGLENRADADISDEAQFDLDEEEIVEEASRLDEEDDC